MNEREFQVVCLCAGWCGVCNDYRPVFDDASAVFAAHAAFSWVDIEDDADLLGDIDVENFPTVLIAAAGRPVFFGPITPQPATLARLIEVAIAGGLGEMRGAPALGTFLEKLRHP